VTCGFGGGGLECCDLGRGGKKYSAKRKFPQDFSAIRALPDFPFADLTALPDEKILSAELEKARQRLEAGR